MIPDTITIIVPISVRYNAPTWGHFFLYNIPNIIIKIPINRAATESKK